jgi:delta-lactam-biosynthetic de-N-acetylase
MRGVRRVAVLFLAMSVVLSGCSLFGDSAKKEEPAPPKQNVEQKQFATGNTETEESKVKEEEVKEDRPFTSEEIESLEKFEKKNVILNGSRKKKKVALTFDDGPHHEYTPKILDILAQEDVKATFFLIGQNIESGKELVKRAVDEGHTVANHTWTHPDLSKTASSDIKKELRKTKEKINEVTGKNVMLLRPPYGAISGKSNVVKKEGYAIINWDVDTNDWRPGRTSSDIVQVVKDTVQSGSIILMHDGGGKRDATVNALPEMIQYLKEAGYEFVTVDQLLDVRPYSNS